jgi:hypothetical protein
MEKFLCIKLFIFDSQQLYFIWNCLIKIKPVFVWINSCSVWKFCFKSKSTLFYRARPSSLLPRPAHARCPAPLLVRQTPDRPSPPTIVRLAGCQPPPPRHVILLRVARSSQGPSPPPSSLWRHPRRTPPHFPFSFGQKLSTPSVSPFRSVAVFGTKAHQHPFLPSPQCSCIGLERSRPHRICVEAPPPFPSSVSSASAPSLPNRLGPNDRIPSPSRRTSPRTPSTTASTFGVDVCNRQPELHPSPPACHSGELPRLTPCRVPAQRLPRACADGLAPSQALASHRGRTTAWAATVVIARWPCPASRRWWPWAVLAFRPGNACRPPTHYGLVFGPKSVHGPVGFFLILLNSDYSFIYSRNSFKVINT